MKNKKTYIILIVAFLIGLIGAVSYKAATDDTDKKEESKEEVSVEENIDSPEGKESKQDIGGQESTIKDEKPVSGDPESTSDLEVLGTSVTAQKAYDADSIDISFYLEGAGTYTAQEKIGGKWQTVIANEKYPGKGGFLVGEMSSTELSKTYRVLKNEGGKYTSVTKEFTISRSEVISAGGIKTYN